MDCFGVAICNTSKGGKAPRNDQGARADEFALTNWARDEGLKLLFFIGEVGL
jgi:hypothetical protein